MVLPGRWLPGALALRAANPAAPNDATSSGEDVLQTLMQLYNRVNFDVLRALPDDKPPFTLLKKLIKSEPEAVAAGPPDAWKAPSCRALRGATRRAGPSPQVRTMRQTQPRA